MTETTARVDWQAWQDSWDRQQTWYMPDREERFRVMLDMVEALAGTEPVVLDLACGTGTITDRLLKRFPGARSTGVDLDPVLLTIAEGHFEGDDRAEFVTADLTDPEWTAALPHRSYDAVLTATALHWMRPDPLRELYGKTAQVLRDGGVFLNADHMVDESAPRLNEAAKALLVARQEEQKSAGQVDWSGWWSLVAEDPVLGEIAPRRFELLGDPRGPVLDHGRKGPLSTDWHASALRDSGFGEARQIWCSTSDAVMAALR